MYTKGYFITSLYLFYKYTCNFIPSSVALIRKWRIFYFSWFSTGWRGIRNWYRVVTRVTALVCGPQQVRISRIGNDHPVIVIISIYPGDYCADEVDGYVKRFLVRSRYVTSISYVCISMIFSIIFEPICFLIADK